MYLQGCRFSLGFLEKRQSECRGTFLFGVDVIVRSQAEIERRIKLGDWFMEDVATKGKVLYERPHG